jgi:hypothetical protein
MRFIRIIPGTLMSQEKIVAEIARELGLNFTDSIIDTMVRLLDAGMPPESLVRLVQDTKAELHQLHG